MLRSFGNLFSFTRKQSIMSTNKIAIHKDTQHPTRAWQKLAVKRTVQKVIPLDPSTPISDDNIRFVCMSDTHSQIQKNPDIIPPGDVILHAGDITKIGGAAEIKVFDDFMGQLPHQLKIIIAGNHDLTFDDDMVKNRRDYLKKQFGVTEKMFEEALQYFGVDSIKQLLSNCIYLEDTDISICGIKIYGSPWQPEFCDWGFNLPRGEKCLEKWDLIPDETDILITHGPPVGPPMDQLQKGIEDCFKQPSILSEADTPSIGVTNFNLGDISDVIEDIFLKLRHGDSCFDGQKAGCVELLTTIEERVRPKYHVFGHIHEGHGDSCFDGQKAGCVELLTTIEERVRPKYHVFGHIHEGYGCTTDGQTTYINASTCTLRYQPLNPPIVFDFPVPEGHSKDQLLSVKKHELRIREK